MLVAACNLPLEWDAKASPGLHGWAWSNQWPQRAALPLLLHALRPNNSGIPEVLRAQAFVVSLWTLECASDSGSKSV